MNEFGEGHPIMMVILLNLATLNEALAISKQIFGIAHPLTGIILINLKNACTKVNDLTGALKYGENAYEIFKKLFGETHIFCKN